MERPRLVQKAKQERIIAKDLSDTSQILEQKLHALIEKQGGEPIYGNGLRVTVDEEGLDEAYSIVVRVGKGTTWIAFLSDSMNHLLELGKNPRLFDLEHTLPNDVINGDIKVPYRRATLDDLRNFEELIPVLDGRLRNPNGPIVQRSTSKFVDR